MSKLDPKLFLVDEDERLRIKNRTKQLIKLAGGPEIFQHSAGVPKDMLSKYGSLSEPNMINAAVIVDLGLPRLWSRGLADAAVTAFPWPLEKDLAAYPALPEANDAAAVVPLRRRT